MDDLNDRQALLEISRIVVETCDHLREIFGAQGRTEPAPEEVVEAVKRGALDPDLDASWRRALIASVRTLAEDLIAARVAPMLPKP
jgi:hypothetical protein